MFAKPEDIYNQLYTIIDGEATFDYFKTKQRGFYPRSADNINPRMFPWVFMEFGGIAGLEVFRLPQVWSYEFTIPLVVMTWADLGDVEDLVFRTNALQNKGIGNMMKDVGNYLWTNYKLNHFGIDGVRDWTISRVGTPSVLSVQFWLTNPYVRGLQMDLVFSVREALSV